MDGIRISTDWADIVGAASTPSLIADPSILNGFSYPLGAGPSASQSYDLSGINLTGFPGNITITGSTNYEVSSDNSAFGPTATIPFTSATLAATPVYVRLKTGLAYGTYNGETIGNAGGGASNVNVTCNGMVTLPEPTNHATGFMAGAVTTVSIPLSWTDATGGTVPTAYLVKGATGGFGNIADPVDLIAEADGLLVKNVAAGVEAVDITGLAPGVTYYFKIFPYTNEGEFVNYKTDGTVPQTSASTTLLSFRSLASGAWNAAATWEISNDNSTWNPATTEIPIFTSSDVTVRNGHTVNLPLSYNNGKAKHLVVENGATLWANSASGSCFLYVYGDITNNGAIGGTGDVIGFDIEGPSCTISGSGTFNIARMAKFTTANPVTDLLINQDITLQYSHASNPALSNNNPATTTFNITVAPGKRLSVLNAGINLNGCSLTLQSDATGTASLIDKGITGSGAASVVVQRYINGWTNDMNGWHLLSSPVASQTIAPAFTDPTPGNYDFYMWDETTDTWLNEKVGANNITSFVPGTGYLVAYQSTGTRQFLGTLNTDDVAMTNLTLTPAMTYSGWNLLGNPFPAALKWNDGVNWTAPAEIAATAKIWNEGLASYTDIAPSGIIPAMNGFMVQVLSGSPASLTIPKAARVHDATPWYKSAEHSIALMAYDRENNTAQKCVINASPLATEGYDRDFDSRFLAGYAPQFFAYAGEEMLSTHTVPSIDESRVIEMGFVKNAAGEFSIGLDPDAAAPAMPVYLTDKQTGIMTELKAGVEYTFTATENDETGRFRLHFGALGIDDPATVSPFSVYASAGNIYILSNHAGPAQATVTNLLGQTVLQMQAEGNSLTTISAGSLTNGVYLVTLQGGKRTFSGKVIISK